MNKRHETGNKNKRHIIHISQTLLSTHTGQRSLSRYVHCVHKYSHVCLHLYTPRSIHIQKWHV